ncbi:cobalt transporter, partial [Cylindrospermopsis raciborskii S07]
MLKISLPLRLQLSLIVVIGTAFLKYHSWLQLYIYGAIALVWVVILGVEIVKLGGLLGGEL